MRLPVQLYRRKSDTHKGDYGYVFILGGSRGLTGAVCLAAQACLRIGAGLVKVGVPFSLNNIFETKLTEAITLLLKEIKGNLSVSAFEQIKGILSKIDVVALGCGVGLYPSTKKLMLKIIKEIDKPLIVDADAINALAENLEVLKKRKSKNLILTPHLKEFSRLIKVDIEEIKKKRKFLVKEFAFKYNLILVLKGYRTLV
ncbi:MAG TPA: NAD(P)H-hydrate dehydratase, partial [Candidatus Omnitrophica bacterium]|nr:NAD(P)H-hydrate dehydratase [Candidatus Omnitrophota bacterium]